MMAGGIKDPAVLDELESHLREEIEQQMRAGANEESAFSIAQQKIGRARELKTEFRKNRFASVLEKLMIAIAVLVAAFGIFLFSATMILCYESWGERLAGFAALGFILLAVFGWPRIVPLLPIILEKRKRQAVEVACLLAGFGICTFYVQVIVHRFERPGQMLPVIGFWGILPIAVGFALACAIERAAQRSKAQINA